MSYTPTPDEVRQMHDLVSVEASRIVKGRSDLDREDLKSEGFYALVRLLERYDPESEATLWTYAQYRVRGAMLDHIRSEARRRAHIAPVAIEDVQEGESTNWDLRDLHELISRLESPKHRALLRAHCAGETYVATAERLGVSDTTVRRGTEAAIAELRRLAAA